ncbi:unnamed protein product, partial [Choristocarpus tenellus]
MSSNSFYSSMPNTNKAMFQVMCGLMSSLETSWVEFEHQDLLDALCLPNLLRAKLGYKSRFLTGSGVGGLACLGFDSVKGFAGDAEQGGHKMFKSRKVQSKVSFAHGTFEKVNYLGYDDHIVIDPAIDFLLGSSPSGSPMSTDTATGVHQGVGGKLLTILTV